MIQPQRLAAFSSDSITEALQPEMGVLAAMTKHDQIAWYDRHTQARAGLEARLGELGLAGARIDIASGTATQASFYPPVDPNPNGGWHYVPSSLPLDGRKGNVIGIGVDGNRVVLEVELKRPRHLLRWAVSHLLGPTQFYKMPLEGSSFEITA